MFSDLKEPPTHWAKKSDVIWPPGSTNIAARGWSHKIVPMTVLRSISAMKDGSVWLHVSLARPDRLPSWEEIRKVANEFIGDDTECFHMIPKKQDYVNVHNYCLHIWKPMDGGKMPNLQTIAKESGA